MPRGTILSSNERKLITQKLSQRITVPQIARDLQRDTRTIKKAINDINFKSKTRSNKGSFMLSKRDMRKLTIIVKKHPLLSSKQVFAKAGLPHIKKDTRCRALRKIALLRKVAKNPPLSIKNKKKRLEWARKYMKQQFGHVIFTDECRATLDSLKHRV